MATEIAMTLPTPPSGSANQELMLLAQPRRNIATIVTAQPTIMNGLRRPKRDFERLLWSIKAKDEYRQLFEFEADLDE